LGTITMWYIQSHFTWDWEIVVKDIEKNDYRVEAANVSRADMI
jgi:hypothetical protein